LIHDDLYLNDDSSYCSESCLSVASSSFTAALYPIEIEEKFDVGNVIGDGNFAVVRKCVCKQTKEAIALKVIDKAKCVGKEEMVENEVQLLKRVDHPHIVKLIDFWDITDRFYLAIEFMPGGDLFDALVSARYYGESEAAQMMCSLASALEYLHDLNVVHRDVKPENLLVYETGDGRKKLKLTDFGLATEAKDSLFTVCGTPTYVAPEILAETGYGLKVDIWAAGVIMYIMLCGFPPFVSMSNNQEELFQTILSGHYDFPRPYWNQISNAAKGLIQGMLQLDADDRYSASEVLIHPWITSEAHVDQDFEQLSSLVNQAAAEQRERIEAGEFFHSRRRSMDDLSTTSADGGSTFSKDNTDFGPTESSG